MKKVKPDNSKTIYVGGIYEVDKTSGGSVTRTVTYYPVTGAMRINSTLYYILKDHLGSASVVTDTSGNILGENRYYPFGETRLTTGTIYTDKLFTGQREMAGLGIYHYQARFYPPKLGRFLSADTIVPSYANPQSLNRFSYVTNNPLKYTDPSGHRACSTDEECKEMGITSSGKTYLDFKGYNTWERRILRRLYDKGGRNAEHGVQYILAHDIHISVGTSGDWQSLGSIEGWYDRKDNTIFLNPNQGHNTSDMPSAWGLGAIIHEAKHLEQGTPLTKYKELEAAQIGIEVSANFGQYGVPGQLPPPGRDADTLALSLSHDPQVINAYSRILRRDSFWYWIPYSFLPIDSPRPRP